MPVISEGSRSGVNWMRWNEQPSDFASDFASVVLPMPGTSSNSTCPSQSKATISRSITASLPTMTRPPFWRTVRAASCTCRISSVCVIDNPSREMLNEKNVAQHQHYLIIRQKPSSVHLENITLCPQLPQQPARPRQSAQIPTPGQARRTTPERPNPHARPAAPRQPPQASRKRWPYYIRNVSLTWLPEPCRRSYIVGPALAAGLGRGGWPGGGRLTWPGAADLAGGGQPLRLAWPGLAWLTWHGRPGARWRPGIAVSFSFIRCRRSLPGR